MAYSVDRLNGRDGEVVETYRTITIAAKFVGIQAGYLGTKLNKAADRGERSIKVNGYWLARVSRVELIARQHETPAPTPKPSLDDNYQAELAKAKPGRKRSDGTNVVHRFNVAPGNGIAPTGTFYCQCCGQGRSHKDEARVCTQCVTNLKQIREAVLIIGKAILGGKI